MTNCLWRFKNLIVVPTLVRLVPEEVDVVEPVGLDKPQAVGLVPPLGEDVERDLPPDRVRQAQTGELLLQGSDHRLADSGPLVEPLELVALLLRAVAPDGGHVDHAVAELDERPPLDRDVEVGDVAEDKVDEFFQIVLSQELFQGLDLEELSRLVGDEAVLGEDVVVGGGGFVVFIYLFIYFLKKKKNKRLSREEEEEKERQRGAASESDDETKKKKEKAFQLLLSLPLQPPHSLFSPSCSLILTRSEPPTMPTLTCCELFAVWRIQERKKRKRKDEHWSLFFMRRPTGLFFSLSFANPSLPPFSINLYLAQLLEEVERLCVGSLFVER